MYTIESLNNQDNYCFNDEHKINDYDVNLINRLVTILEKELTSPTLKEGVKVRCIGKKVTYDHGHLERDRDKDGKFTVCMCPGVYVGLTEESKPWFLVSGGYFAKIKDNDLPKFKYTGETELKDFWTFGHNGACGNGGIRFQARVAVFEYEDEQIY